MFFSIELMSQKNKTLNLLEVLQTKSEGISVSSLVGTSRGGVERKNDIYDVRIIAVMYVCVCVCVV